MPHVSPETLQLLSGLAGSFIGGLLFVWRVRRQLPDLLRRVAVLLANAMRANIAEEARAVLVAELEPTTRRLKVLEEGHAELEHATAQLWRRELERNPEPKAATP